MNFNLLGDEEYKKLLSIFMCNIEITPDSKLFTSGNYLKPYGDKAGSIAIGYGLDLKVNSIFTVTDLYKKVFGETWQLSDNEKDIASHAKFFAYSANSSFKFHFVKKLINI